MLRFAIDVGGTFTDILCLDNENQRFLVGKVPTTPANPDEACINAVETVLTEEMLNKAALFCHGTTVGLNAILERRGATVGLLCSAGFRDILEIRRGGRPEENNNLLWAPKEAFIGRDLRIPVRGRMLLGGEELEPFHKEDVVEALQVFESKGVAAIAVAFINAHKFPDHELAAEKVLREQGFEGDISLSHVVSGEFDEYARTCTTVIDAYVKARLAHYLRRLDSRLADRGFSGNSLIARSGGGAVSFSEAENRPFETINSGPVGGAEGAATLARLGNFGDLITADVGGTSFDTCLIVGNRPSLAHEGMIDGEVLQGSWVDIRSIGSGGGSIAHIDKAGMLQVGPRSAGSVPGPACYGRGGTEPATTDAAFYLGMLGDGRFESGMTLDRDKSEQAIAGVAGRLGLDVEQTAIGIMQIASASMANAIREITIERGVDPRRLKLCAFGGAGPMLSTLIARDLGISEIIIPPFAGNFSAWGLMTTDPVQENSTSVVLPLTRETLDGLGSVITNLFEEIDRRVSDLAHLGERVESLEFDMQYEAQVHRLRMPVKIENRRLMEDRETIERKFHALYQDIYSVELTDPLIIVNCRAVIRTVLPDDEFTNQEVDMATGASDTRPDVKGYSFTRKEWLDFPVSSKTGIGPDEIISGPAIVYENTATTYVDAGCSLERGPLNSLVIRQNGDAS